MYNLSRGGSKLIDACLLTSAKLTDKPTQMAEFLRPKVADDEAWLNKISNLFELD